MPAQDFERLRPDLEAITCGLGDVLVQPDEPNVHLYFLESGLASQIAVTPTGRRLEVGIYGRDGVGPSSTILGIDRSPLLTLIQGKGEGFRLRREALAAALADSPTLHMLLLRYVQAFTVQVAYTALSNGSSVIGERLARWLLMCQDRLGGDAFSLTQEFLGVMLGVRRAGVSDALRILEQADVIRVARGRIQVLDRKKLEATAGASYGVPEAEYRRLVGPINL